jgi:HEAT repeat protein
MKPVCLLIALLTCSPAAGLAQVPPAPPAPTAIPAVPPVPPAPPRPVRAPLVEVALPDIDIQMALDIAHDAIRDIDFHAITEQAMRAGEEAKQSIDLQLLKEQADRLKEDAKYMFQGRVPMQVFGPGRGDERGQYSSALNMVERRQYEQALVRLDQVVTMKGPHADAALYWKSYSQYKLGRTDDALATIAELRRSHAQSRYLSDARVLEADARQTSGKPLTGDADDDDLKVLAIQALQHSNPTGAVPMLESVLTKTNSLMVKKRALFVLASNEQPAAHQLLLRYAKGAGNPDLQLQAVRYLGARKQATTVAELDDIYNSTQDLDVRRAVLDALIALRDRTTLLRIAGSDAAVDLRRRAINGLGNDNLMTAPELFGLYQKETDKEMRRQFVNALGSMGAIDQLSQVIKTEKEADVRNQAIRSLGNIKNERSAQMLVDLYTSTEDAASRKAVISSLSNQGNATALVAIARKETNKDLRLDLVRRLTDLASRNKVAMDYLMEFIK